MRRFIVLLLGLCLAPSTLAQGGSGFSPVCRVTILGQSVGYPDENGDGLVLLRAFVSTSTSCRSGQVEVAVFPSSVCRKRPQADLDDAKPMIFVYKPAVLKITVEPGNIGSGVVEISSSDAGNCTFNSHIASWGMHLTPEAPRSSIRALEDYSRTLGSFKSASPSGFKVNRCRPPAGRNERRL